jgi:hypothetical protein
MRRKAEKAGVRIGLVTAHPGMIRVFHITSLDKLFPIFPGESDALAAMGVSNSAGPAAGCPQPEHPGAPSASS